MDDLRARPLEDPGPFAEAGGSAVAAFVDALASLHRAAGGRPIVALTGAGLSTDSGIPDYRSPASLARPRRPIQGPEFVRSATVRRRYWARAVIGWERFRLAEPNAGHRALASLETAGVVSAVITQNVDRLHARAGSRRVLELHGALAEVVCISCATMEERQSLQARLLARNPDWLTTAAPVAPDGDAEIADEDLVGFEVVDCAMCGGVLKPRVVFFGDNVARALVDEAFECVDTAGALLVVGTSLAVFSGYRFLLRAADRGVPIAIVNRGPVRGEARATLRIDAGTTEVLEALARTFG